MPARTGDSRAVNNNRRFLSDEVQLLSGDFPVETLSLNFMRVISKNFLYEYLISGVNRRSFARKNQNKYVMDEWTAGKERGKPPKEFEDVDEDGSQT